MPRSIIPTCETAVSTIPEWHRADLKGSEERLVSPEGWSPGALTLAQALSMKVHCPLLHSEMNRLILDLARHPEDEERFSELSRKFTPDQRRKLDERQKSSYLVTLRTRVDTALKRGEEPCHVSLDTRAGIDPAWLVFEYDSSRVIEGAFVAEWKAALQSKLPQAVLREQSSPTRSLAGLLRAEYPQGFCSIRVIANQRAFLEGDPIAWSAFKKAIVDSVPR